MRYFVYREGGAEGPWGLSELTGKIARETWVCVEGGTEWLPAGSVPELATCFAPVQTSPPSAPNMLSPDAGLIEAGLVEDPPPADLPDSLKNLWRVCRRADDALLLEQKKAHWRRYFKNEQAIIEAEIARRKINPGQE